MSVRNYAILYGGVRRVSSGASIAGGNAITSTPQHALDGVEHTAAADTSRLDASATAHGLLPKLSGDPADALRGDGTWAPTDVAETVPGVLTPDGSPFAITTGARYRSFAGAAWLDRPTDAVHGVGDRLLVVYRDGADHVTDGKVVGKILTATAVSPWTFTLGSQFDIEDVANSVGPADGVSVIDDTIYVAAYEYTGTAAVSPHVLVCNDPASSFTSSSTWTRHEVVYSSGSTYNVVVGRVRRLQDGDYILSAYWQSPGTDTSGLLKVSDPTDWSSPTVIAIASGYNENDIEELPDGRLVAHLRNTAQTHHYSSISDDAGATWSTPVQLYEAMGLPTFRPLTSGLGLTVYRSADGSLDTAWRQTQTAISDSGWTSETILDDGGGHPVGEHEYATIIQLDNNNVLAVYAYDAGAASPPANIYSQVFTDSSVIGTATPGLVAVSSGDTDPSYLEEKLLAGTGVAITKGSAGSDETLTFTVDDAPASEVALVDAAGNYVSTNVEGALAEIGTSIARSLLTVDPGTPSYDDSGDDVVVSLASKWGYDTDGPYYDSAGAASGEEAILALDPSDGLMVVVPYNP